LREIINYLLDEWADDFAETFAEQINKTLTLLELHHTLYYIILRQEVIIINLYQNSRNKN
jgi:hypothetical protein